MRIPIILSILIWFGGVCFSQSAQESNPYYSLSKEERWELLKEIVTPVVLKAEEDMPIREIHKRFWEIVDKHKWNQQELLTVQESLAGLHFMEKCFLQDVVWAFERKQVPKNSERGFWERRMTELGLFSEEAAEKRKEFIEGVAKGESVLIEDLWGGPWQEKVLGEEDIESYRSLAAQAEDCCNRFFRLFNREYKE
ncbi:MAG TPA: hypothetical protein ACFYD1_09735 [Candidatus Hypogeohydataceae bacterium YC38]